jgi:hypothetical protein
VKYLIEFKAGATSSARRISSMVASRPSVEAAACTSSILLWKSGMLVLTITDKRRKPGTTSRNRILVELG